MKDKLPENVNLKILDKGSQGPDWDGVNKDDPKYTEWQYVKLVVSESKINNNCNMNFNQVGKTGSPPNFFSYDDLIDLTNTSRFLRFTFDCKYVPDYIRIIYKGKIMNIGWVGVDKVESRILLGTLLYNTKNLDKSLSNGITPQKIKILDANGYINSYITNNPKSINPFKTVLPDLNYGKDGKGKDIFTYNKNLIPYTINSGVIKPNGYQFTLDIGDDPENECTLQVISPFSQTNWDLNMSCVQENQS